MRLQRKALQVLARPSIPGTNSQAGPKENTQCKGHMCTADPRKPGTGCHKIWDPLRKMTFFCVMVLFLFLRGLVFDNLVLYLLLCMTNSRS